MQFQKDITPYISIKSIFRNNAGNGLFFIYPKAYRLFDVDDLIINTTGGILGYLVTPLFQKLLPTRDVRIKFLQKKEEMYRC